MTETVTLTADAGRVVLTVDGLACPFCAYGLEKKLEALEATGRIDIGLNAGNVYLELKRGKTVPDEELARIVKDAGFALRGIEHIRAGGSGR
ncbi:MAG: heavy-metal-associated domain-containing protein [Gemmatimonadetes bacterium]|nr:heavy-metal-associated domain-containing protein [Gemmatimonadota bacterium]